MKKIYMTISAVALALSSSLVLAQSKFEKMHLESFKANGIATMDRLDQDETQNSVLIQLILLVRVI